MQFNSLLAGGAVVVGEIEVSPVTLYTAICSQTLLYQTLYIRWNENDINNFLKTDGFYQKYSDIKTAQVSILKRAVLNQVFSPPANHSNVLMRDLQFVMSQIQENNFVVQKSRSL